MNTYIVLYHYMKGEKHVFTFSSLGQEHLKAILGQEEAQIREFDLKCKRIHDFPLTLIELEDGIIVNMEKAEGSKTLVEKMQLHEQK